MGREKDCCKREIEMISVIVMRRWAMILRGGMGCYTADVS